MSIRCKVITALYFHSTLLPLYFTRLSGAADYKYNGNAINKAEPDGPLLKATTPLFANYLRCSRVGMGIFIKKKLRFGR